MASPWLRFTLFSAGMSLSATPFLFLSSDAKEIPQELNSKKDWCWGFKIGEGEEAQDIAKVKLLKFGFWQAKGDTCFEAGLAGFNEMVDAGPESFDLVKKGYENYESGDLSKPWGRKKTPKAKSLEELERISESNKKHWKLAMFSECVKTIKSFSGGLVDSDTGLKHSVIGQFIDK